MRTSYTLSIIMLLGFVSEAQLFEISNDPLFLDAEGIPDDILGKVYMLLNWFSHMAFLTFICFVLTVFPLTLLFPRTKFIRGAASVIFTV